MPTSLSFLNIHQMFAEPAANFADVGIVHRWGYNDPGDDGDAVYRRVRTQPAGHVEWFNHGGAIFEMIGNGSGLSMRAFGLFGVHDFHSGPDITPYLNRAHDHGLATGFRRWRWPSGYYRCDTQPRDINFPGVQHIGDPAGMAFAKNFQSGAGQVGVLNFRADASHGLCQNVGILSLPGSQANGIGTGCLASVEPPPGSQANKITFLRCNLTARVPSGQAGTQHGLIANGTHRNTASAAQVRGLQIIDTDIFGVETNGWALFIWGCSNVSVRGGGITTGGAGKRAKTFISSWASGGPASQNITFAPNGCSEVELSNAHHVTLSSPVFEGHVFKDNNSTSDINGIGHAKGGLSANWTPSGTWQGKIGS